MEEEKIIVNEQVEKTLSKDEILERSRSENTKKGDERNQQLHGKGLHIATMIGLTFLVVIYIVNTLVYKVQPTELAAVIFSVEGANEVLVYKFGANKKKIHLAIGIVMLLCGVAMLVLWILRLCGVK